MSQKLYFRNEDSEMCHTLDYFIDEMKEQGVSEMVVYKAKRDTCSDYFFCKANQQVGVKGEDYIPCGNECADYIPRNGKSGCCKYRGYCYENTMETKTIKIN